MERVTRQKPKVRDWKDSVREPIERRRKRKRTKPEDRVKYEEDRVPRGKKWHVRRTLSGLTLSYQKKKHAFKDDEEYIWYAVGKVKVAYVHTGVNMQDGNIAVYMNSNNGNGGEYFDTLKEAERYIREQLEGEL